MEPGSNDKAPSVESIDGKNKSPRHPRWTQIETLVLIEGKKIAEERGGKGRRFGSDQFEPKWDFVSSFCKKNGVNREPVQCRKRWGNLLTDFKKIKTWESQVTKECDSFWMMRNDLRREKKLPGFFDREIYDLVDGKTFVTEAERLALVMTSVDENKAYGSDGVEVEDVDEEDANNGLFSEFEQVAEDDIGTAKEERTDGKRKKIPSPVPISEMRYQPFHQAYSNQGPHFRRGSASQEGVKRRKHSSSNFQNIDVGIQLLVALEKSTTLLNEQLETQKLNSQLDKEQRKEQHECLITILTKMTDALEKIANKS